MKKLTKNGVPVELSSSIGKMLSAYNIIEYKSPDDELGIDAFFQAYTYACYYKSSADLENERKDRDITVILVKQRYPLSLVRYLESSRLKGKAAEYGEAVLSVVDKVNFKQVQEWNVKSQQIICK